MPDFDAKPRPSRRAAIAAVALLCLTDPARAAEPVDRLRIPGPLLFDGKSYALAWSARPSPGYYKQEYLPAGQVLASYSSMLLIEVVESGATVDSALAAQVRMLNARKGSDPLVNLSIIQNKQSGEAILDFILGGRTSEGTAIAEWNAYRYAPHKRPDGRTGVMLFAISHRAYGNDEIRNFLGRLKTFRPGEINRIAQHRLPSAQVSP